MNIALIGYGNMGKELEALIHKDKKHRIVSISYKKKSEKLDIQGIKKADIAIDFTSPTVVLSTIEAVIDVGVNMVIGTTGWYNNLPQVEKMVRAKKGGLIYGQNFSIGANIFFQIVEYASKLFYRYGSYDVAGFEMHHMGKADSPSGTAKKLARVIMNNFPSKTTLQTEKLDRQIREEELHIASLRVGRNVGYHEVLFDSNADTVSVIHTSHNRIGFAKGALLAGEFMYKKEGIYCFDELFAEGVIA